VLRARAQQAGWSLVYAAEDEKHRELANRLLGLTTRHVANTFNAFKDNHVGKKNHKLGGEGGVAGMSGMAEDISSLLFSLTQNHRLTRIYHM
jgi:hypothetical protein